MLTESAALLRLVELAETSPDVVGPSFTSRSHRRALSVSLATVSLCRRLLTITFGDVPASAYRRWSSEPDDSRGLSAMLVESAAAISLLEPELLGELPPVLESNVIILALKRLARAERELEVLVDVVAIVNDAGADAPALSA